VDPIIVERFTLLDEDQQFVEHRLGSTGNVLSTGDVELVPPRDDPCLGEGILDYSQVRVALSEEVNHQVVARDAQPYLSL
jgi:hypothetical protein